MQPLPCYSYWFQCHGKVPLHKREAHTAPAGRITECCSELYLGFLLVIVSLVCNPLWDFLLKLQEERLSACPECKWFPVAQVPPCSSHVHWLSHSMAVHGAKPAFTSTWQLTRQRFCAWLPNETLCQLNIPRSTILGADSIQSMTIHFSWKYFFIFW